MVLKWFTENIQALFGKKPDEELRPNPDYLLYCISDKKHAVYEANPDDYIVDDTKTVPRRKYKGYPRDVDENLDDKEQLKILSEPKDNLIAPKEFTYTVGRGNWSHSRGITFLFPNNPEDLPENLKPLFSSFILYRKAQFDIIKLRQQTDRQKAIEYESLVSLFQAQLTQEVTKMADDLKNLGQKMNHEIQGKNA